ncbi:methylmalonyl Co-A mutase-associated GTPase MeaB [Echinicola sediminis]
MLKSNRERLSPEQYCEGIRKGDRAMLSRAITLVESKLESDQELTDQVIDMVMPFTGNSIRVGITGAPGVGKSTFIEYFGQLLLQKGHKLAVLTVDPSSVHSGGSILADKTRMEVLAKSPKAFIRPSPSARNLGGVGAKTREALLLCEASGYDVVLVETVGVGQSEVTVKEMVDFFLFLVQPGAGDELQGVKRGIMEMADAIAVNKADGDNLASAKQTQLELSEACKLLPLGQEDWSVKVELVSALEQNGLEKVWELILQFMDKMKKNGFFESHRAEQRIHWFYTHVQQTLEDRFYQSPQIKDSVERVLTEVKNGQASPKSMARNLVEGFLKK